MSFKPKEIKIRAGETVAEDKAITLRDFMVLEGNVDDGFKRMRETCLGEETRRANFVCAAYSDQVKHYIRSMLRTRILGERSPVSALLRRMGPEETAVVEEMENLWKRAEKEFPEFVEDPAPRAGPEYLEEEIIDDWEKRLTKMIGDSRFRKVKDIQRGVEKGEAMPPKEERPSPPSPPKREEELPDAARVRKKAEFRRIIHEKMEKKRRGI